MNTSLPASPGVDEVYRLHHGWLCTWLQRRLNCRDTAADLAQDTFVRVLLRAETFRLSQPRPLLATIARGLLIDHWRRAELEAAYRDAVAHLPVACQPSEEARAQIMALVRDLAAMLDRSKPVVREVFILIQLRGLSGAEVAQRLNLSLSTVERHLAAALRRCYQLRSASL